MCEVGNGFKSDPVTIHGLVIDGLRARLGKRQKPTGAGLAQVLVEWGIVPGPIVPACQQPEAGEELLRDCGGNVVIRGIAKVDATAQRSRIACGASSAPVLPGTGLAVIEFANRWRGVGDQQRGLGCSQEKRVTIVLEPAAPTAQLADRAVASDSLIELGVQRSQRGAHLGQIERLGRGFRLAGSRS